MLILPMLMQCAEHQETSLNVKRTREMLDVERYGS